MAPEEGSSEGAATPAPSAPKASKPKARAMLRGMTMADDPLGDLKLDDMEEELEEIEKVLAEAEEDSKPEAAPEPKKERPLLDKLKKKRAQSPVQRQLPKTLDDALMLE